MRLPYHLGMPGVLDATERRLRPLYGTGHYSTVDWSQHHHYRRGQSMGPAIVSRMLDQVRRDTVPDHDPNALDDWQVALGTPDASGKAEDRLDLLLTVAQMPRDHTLSRIEAGLILLAGGDYFALTDRYTGTGSNESGMSYLVVVGDPITPSQSDYRWRLCSWYLRRMTPAHVECIVEFVDQSMAPCLLGSEDD